MAVTAVSPGTASGVPARTEVLAIRGHQQVLHLYGEETGAPVIVASGDGGWMHLAPHAAEVLAGRGFFVVGLDSRAYLESFTVGVSSLTAEDVSRDIGAVVARAARATSRRPALIGVSEGAGLVVLAASDVSMQARVEGVVTLGLPDRNELAWHWKDAVVYVTHGAANEPNFSARSIVGRVAPLPLAAIYSDHDEFVPEADVRAMMDAAGAPKRLWMVPASNHRFSDNLAGCDAALTEALRWASAARR